MDARASYDPAATEGSRPVGLRARDARLHRSARAGFAAHRDVGGTLEPPRTAGRAQHSDRSDVERARVAGSIRRSAPLGRAGHCIRRPAAAGRRRAVAQSLRPSRRYDGAAPRRGTSPRNVGRGTRSRAFRSEARWSHSGRAGLVARTRTGIGPHHGDTRATLQQPGHWRPRRHPVVWLCAHRGERPAAVLRRRQRLSPGLRRDRRTVWSVRRRPHADRGIRTALVHALCPHESGRSGGGLPRPERARDGADSLGHVQAHRRSDGRAAGSSSPTKRWTSRRSARAPRGMLPDCHASATASSRMARLWC